MPHTTKKLFAAVVVAVCSSIAAAQQDSGLGLGLGQDESAPKEVAKPPIARKADQSPPALWNLLAFLVILGAVFGANMIPSKRGHQD